MKTNKDYQITFKAKQKAAGLVQFHDWCYPDDKPQLRKLAKELRDNKEKDNESTVDNFDDDGGNRSG